MEMGSTRSHSRRFVLATIGSRGDLYPLLAVGRGLVKRGHHVTLAVPDRFADLVTGAGMTHHTLRPDPDLSAHNPLAHGVAPDKRDSEFAVRRLIYPFVEETYRDLLSAAHGADLIAFPIFIFPGPMAAERLDIPWAVLHSAPGSLFSVYDPPYLPPIPWLYPLQRLSPLIPRLFNPIARFSIRSWSTPLHELRAREGFSREKRELLLGGMQSPWLTLALFSSCVGSSQPDWPKPNVVAGFPFYDEASCPDKGAIERFLDAGDPPVVVTLGSVVSKDRIGFLKNSIEAARKTGERLLLIGGADGAYLRSTFTSASLLVVDYVPYSLVFPRSRAVIIAGSIGPLSHALRAGRPMLIISADEGADQPDNALRAVRLGLARWLPLKKATVEILTNELQTLFSDPSYDHNAERWGEYVRSEDGIARACEALEKTAEDYQCVRNERI